MKNASRSFFALLLTAIMLLSLFACSFDHPGDIKQIVDGTDASTGETEKPTEKVTEKSAEKGTEKPEVKKGELTITEQKCFDFNGFSVTAKSVVEDSIWGTGIKMLIENNTTSDYTVSCNAVIVNDCMVSDYFSASVAAGKKANETLYFSSTSLEVADITVIGKVEIYFHVYDSSSYKGVFDSECVTIKTSLFDTAVYTVDSSGHELYNDNGVKIVGKYVDENTIWGSSVLLYVENNSNNIVSVSCDDMSINGYMVSSFFSTKVYPGKHILDDITIMSDDLEKNDIKAIEDVELKFRIYDSDTYKTIANTGAISFNVN